MKIVITGAAGFIGGKLMDFFRQDSRYEVFGYARNSTLPHICNVDLQSYQDVLSCLDRDHPDVVIHCAGSADVGRSVLYPGMDFHHNVGLIHNILFSLKELQQLNCRIVFLSSAAVYGNPDRLPVSENAPRKPMSPYALHKLMGEDVCEYFIHNYGFDIRIARIFSAYGCGLKKQIFWDMTKKIVQTGKLDLYGSGNETRDYIHVSDVVKALCLISNADCSDKHVFNVANGEAVSIREVAELYAQIAGLHSGRISFLENSREGDPLHWRADITLLESLGYKKSINLADGLTEYYGWALEELKGQNREKEK